MPCINGSTGHTPLLELWKCSGCHTCVAHCPQDARPGDVIRALRGLAVREGYVSPDVAGRFEEIEEETKRLRLKKINIVIEELNATD